MTVIATQFDSSGVLMVADSLSTALDGTTAVCTVKKLLRMPGIIFGFGGCAQVAQQLAATMAACEHRTLGLPLIKRFVEISMSAIEGGLSKEFISGRTVGDDSLFVTMMATHDTVKRISVHSGGRVCIKTYDFGVHVLCKGPLVENYIREIGGAKDARKVVEYAITSGHPGVGGPIHEMRI